MNHPLATLARLGALAGLSVLTACVADGFAAGNDRGTPVVAESIVAMPADAHSHLPTAWPAPQAPFDTTPITPVESTGAPAVV